MNMLLAVGAMAILTGWGSPAQAGAGFSATLLGTYATGLADPGKEISSAETVALRGDRMYVTNANDVSLDIVDVSRPASPRLLERVDLKAYGASVNSVDVSAGNLIAVAVAASNKADAGRVVFLDPAGKPAGVADVGAGPDMVVFTPGGDRLLVANEGEPTCYGAGCADAEGSVSVIEVQPMQSPLAVRVIGFDGIDIPQGVRIFGPGATAAQDLEPEYIAVSDDGNTAWVTLQENNAIARLDLQQLAVTALFPLGYKDHALAGNGLDASDKDGAVAVRPWAHLRGMYQPDAVAQFVAGGVSYLMTANEGDARDYKGFVEEMRAGDLAQAHPGMAGIAGIGDKKGLARLNVTTRPPGGDWNNLYAFGGRSVSIRDASHGGLVWDSGDQMERSIADRLPAHFNSNNDKNDFDSRSDNKGPEPEGLAVGRIGDRILAFVGLERIGGIMVYDVTQSAAPKFLQYLTTRGFSGNAIGPDSGPEVLRFVDAQQSPTGRPMLVVANEISGTVNLWDIAPAP